MHPEFFMGIIDTIKMCQQHRFYLLTKQPQNLPKFSPFPDNCWVGVSVTNWASLPDSLYHLSKITASLRYISFEPLLEYIPTDGLNLALHKIGWLIIGAQTKPYKPPEIEWVEEIVRAADRAGVPVFLKDNLLELVNYKSPETEFAFSKGGYYRQEIPAR